MESHKAQANYIFFQEDKQQEEDIIYIAHILGN